MRVTCNVLHGYTCNFLYINNIILFCVVKTVSVCIYTHRWISMFVMLICMKLLMTGTVLSNKLMMDKKKGNLYKIQLLKQKSTVDVYNVWIWWGHEVSVVHQFKLVVISIHNNDVFGTALSGTCESGQWRTPACVI